MIVTRQKATSDQRLKFKIILMSYNYNMAEVYQSLNKVQVPQTNKNVINTSKKVYKKGLGIKSLLKMGLKCIILKHFKHTKKFRN